MFNKNFYPSTPEVVQLMLEPYISEHKDYMYTKPAKFAQEDPEMFDFIWNTVRGK